MLTEWERDSEGNVALTPLIRAHTADLYGVGVGLRLEMSRSPGESNTDLTPVQTVLSVEQAEDLIVRLQLAIDHIRAQQTHGPKN